MNEVTTDEDRWEPKVAAERLAEFHASVLDYVGRVDQAVTGGDLFYLLDKGQALVSAVERLMRLAEELREENTPLGPHLPVVEDYLVRAGQQGYRAIALLHPTARRTAL
jgi:hypothetical protein